VDEYWSRYRSLVDEQIQKAQERGDFDNLPGKGKPLSNLHGPADELWWVREYVRREGLPREALLPTSLRLRKERERLLDRLTTLTSEKDVREMVAELNARSWRGCAPRLRRSCRLVRLTSRMRCGGGESRGHRPRTPRRRCP
jgi:hypothetical protein